MPRGWTPPLLAQITSRGYRSTTSASRPSCWIRAAALATRTPARAAGPSTSAHNVGAYIEGAGAIPIIFSLKLASTVYDIPAVAVTSSLVFTNTAPTAPYRGAGRPEAVYIMERLVDQAARGMHIDPAELRKRNLIRPAHRLDL